VLNYFIHIILARFFFMLILIGSALSPVVSIAESYTHDAAGRVKTLTYSSGTQITYTYDLAGQITQLDLTQNQYTVTLASQVTYLPFGPVKSFTYGNGLASEKVYDKAYRMIQQSVASLTTYLLNDYYAQTNGRGYDSNGNILVRQDQLKNTTQDYGYDALNRLIDSSRQADSWVYTYDKNGNRTSIDMDTGQVNYVYEANSNRLDMIGTDVVQKDGNGNIIRMGGWEFDHTPYNMIKAARFNNVLQGTYTYRGVQRIKKLTSAGTTQFEYDKDGRLLAENDGYRLTREYIYLNNEPLAMIQYHSNGDFNNDGAVDSQDLGILMSYWGNTLGLGDLTYDGKTDAEDHQAMVGYLGKTPGKQLYFIHNDHLGTPQIATDIDGNVVWRAVYTPFGDAVVDEDPDGDGMNVTINLRFPGQYYDQETGLHYNYYRYYDPRMGRYTTSDPIGLRGGLNTYSYAYLNPLRYIDPYGLKSYFGVSTTGTGSIGILAGEVGALFLIDPCSLDVHQYMYVGGGFGLGFGGALTIEVNGIEAESPSDLAGFGLTVNGFAAAGHGAAGNVTGSGPSDNSYRQAGGGYAAGAGAGISGQGTYTWYKGKISANELPQNVKEIYDELVSECNSCDK